MCEFCAARGQETGWGGGGGGRGWGGGRAGGGGGAVTHEKGGSALDIWQTLRQLQSLGTLSLFAVIDVKTLAWREQRGRKKEKKGDGDGGGGGEGGRRRKKERKKVSRQPLIAKEPGPTNCLSMRSAAVTLKFAEHDSGVQSDRKAHNAQLATLRRQNY